MNDYLSDLKANRKLMDKIRDFYTRNGIPTNQIKFNVKIDVDSWGSKVYSLRSNIVNNITTGKLEFADPVI
jgi:hypothetical protein